MLRQRPLGNAARFLYLFVLAFFCMSNTWTGYLGPSRIDPAIQPDTILRFRVLHEWVVPITISIMLLVWFIRLAKYGEPVKSSANTSTDI